MPEDVEHGGSCHCGAVAWTVKAPRILKCIRCNCSICKKKQNNHFILSKDRFTLLKGEDVLTTYTFNQKLAQHRFCSICGVQSFYIPRSNPNDVAIMPHCIDTDTVDDVIIEDFDGQNWEKEMETKAPKAY